MSFTSSSSSSCSSHLLTPTPGPLHVPEQIQTAAMSKPRSLILPKKRRYVDGQKTIITPPQPPTSCPSIPHVPVTNTTTTTSSSTPTTRISATLSTTTSPTSPKTLTSMSIDEIHGECAEATANLFVLKQNNYVQPDTQQQQPLVNHIQHFNPNYEKEDDNENGEPTIKKTTPNKKSPTTTTKKPSTKKTNNNDNEYNEKKPKRKYNKKNKTEHKAAGPPSPPPPTVTTSSNPQRKKLTAVWGCNLSTNNNKISIKLIKPRPIPVPRSPSSSSISSSSSSCSFDLHTPTPSPLHVPEQLQTAAMPEPRSLIIPKKRQSVDDQTTIITPPQPPISCPSIPHVPITNTTTTTSSSTPTTTTLAILSTTTTSPTSPKSLTSMSIDEIHEECAEATDNLLILQQNNYVQPDTQQQQPLVYNIQHFNPNYEKEDDNENGEPTIKKTTPNKKSSTTTTKKPSTKKTNSDKLIKPRPIPKLRSPSSSSTSSSSSSCSFDLHTPTPSPLHVPEQLQTAAMPKPRSLIISKKRQSVDDQTTIITPPQPPTSCPSIPHVPITNTTTTTSSSTPTTTTTTTTLATLSTTTSPTSPKTTPKTSTQTSLLNTSKTADAAIQTTPSTTPKTSTSTPTSTSLSTSTSTSTSSTQTPQTADAATETTPSISAKKILSYFVDSNGRKLLSPEAAEYYKSIKEIQRITVYIFPDDRKRVYDAIKKTKTHEETLSPERLHAATADISDLNTFEKCEKCKLSTERYMVETNVIPDKVFAVNKSPIDYIKHKIITPKLPREPTSELAENEFYEIYRKLDNGNFEKVPKSPDGKCMVYSYIHSNYTKNKFFAIFSQTNRLHYCNYFNFNYIRKSEFHRSVPFIKLTPSTQHNRYYTNRTSVVLYSYMKDLFIELPNDDFFVNKFSTDPNEKYVLRVKKSSSSSFNYIISNKDTLSHALVYGAYQVEQVCMGKFGTGNNYSLDDLIEPTGHALLHSTVFHEDRSQIKISTLTGMQYACCKYENLIQRKRKIVS